MSHKTRTFAVCCYAYGNFDEGLIPEHPKMAFYVVTGQEPDRPYRTHVAQ